MTQQEIEANYVLARDTPSDINEHIHVLRMLADGCDHVTEFGVRGVVSTWAFLASTAKKVTSYDIDDVAVPVVDKFRFLNANVLEIEIEPTNLLFIDTLHTYDQLKKELELHAGKVSDRIAFHDTAIFATTGEDGGRGLMDAIQEFIVDHPEWYMEYESFDNNGLLVIKRSE